MAEFIDFEVSVEEQNEKDKEDEVSDDDLDSLKSFTDDSEVENDRTIYQQFENTIDDILKKSTIKVRVILKNLSYLTFVKRLKRKVKLMVLRTVKKE